MARILPLARCVNELAAGLAPPPCPLPASSYQRAATRPPPLPLGLAKLRPAPPNSPPYRPSPPDPDRSADVNDCHERALDKLLQLVALPEIGGDEVAPPLLGRVVQELGRMAESECCRARVVVQRGGLGRMGVDVDADEALGLLEVTGERGLARRGRA